MTRRDKQRKQPLILRVVTYQVTVPDNAGCKSVLDVAISDPGFTISLISRKILVPKVWVAYV